MFGGFHNHNSEESKNENDNSNNNLRDQYLKKDDQNSFHSMTPNFVSLKSISIKRIQDDFSYTFVVQFSSFATI
jgi:hypothetical protein